MGPLHSRAPFGRDGAAASVRDVAAAASAAGALESALRVALGDVIAAARAGAHGDVEREAAANVADAEVLFVEGAVRQHVDNEEAEDGIAQRVARSRAG